MTQVNTTDLIESSTGFSFQIISDLIKTLFVDMKIAVKADRQNRMKVNRE